MAKKSTIEHNEERARLVGRDKAKRALLRSKARDRDATLEERFAATVKLAKLPRNGAAVRYRRRCFLTGRARGVYREYGVSRIMLRELALDGHLPGVVKASW
jgi:small subunit ribosomal protein S14